MKVTSDINKCFNNVLASVPNIVKKNPRIVDLALLGSHNSFTHLITKDGKVAEKCSKTVRFLGGKILKNFTARYAKTQVVGAYEQLMAGVRFFDVRLHYDNNTFMTKHFFTSGEFADILKDILKFLAENKGEVIVFRFYNKNYYDKGQPHLIDFIKSVSYEGKTLLDYLHYKTRDIGHFDYANITATPYKAQAFEKDNNYNKNEGIYLTDLTYNDVTKNGKESGIVMYGWERKENQTIPHYFYADGSERANWLNTSITAEALVKIDKEGEIIERYSDITKHLFRVNQANLNLSAHTLKHFFYTLKGRSLLKMATEFNSIFIERQNFEDLLAKMPCLSMDYVTSNTNDFNNNVNKKIFAYNKKRCQ